jgi:hypothetical protein
MDFIQLNKINEANRMQVEVGKLLTPDSYKAGKWTLSEIITEDSIPGMYCLLALTGTKPDGKPLTGGPRCPNMFYKLKVLTRQACCRDKDGKTINGWDILPYDETNPEGQGIRPEWEEQPEEGDVVMVKGNMRTEDPDTLAQIGARGRAALSRRDIDPYFKFEYEVDSDGCISVPFEHAAQLLNKNGIRMNAPKFKKLNKVRPDGTYKGQRTITNWHFQEVPSNYKAPRKRGQKQD